MIYTFYSYKGGVGRSMALANIAELFYREGLKVLMVDWDLEAPGLERFFPADNLRDVLDKPGIMDMILDHKEKMSKGLYNIVKGEDLPFQKPIAIDIYHGPSSGSEGKLFLLTAGRRSEEHFAEYATAVLNFDWTDFYKNWEGELYFEWLKEQFEKMADIVLIDSRTGVTEMGGICTYQFADVVVLFCAPNKQNIEGTCEMVHKFKRPEVQEQRHGRALEVLIVPSRVDGSDSTLIDRFCDKFTEKFAGFAPKRLEDNYRRWAPSDVAQRAGPFWMLKIPYVPKYSFEELVAVRELGKASSEDLVKAFINLARAMICIDPSLSDYEFGKFKKLEHNIVVDKKNPRNYATITEAISNANPYDKVLVLPGLYQETLIIDKPINIVGEGNRDNIIIQSKGKSAIIFQANEGKGQISNLSIRQQANENNENCFCIDIAQGILELIGCDITSESSGCIVIHGGAKPILRKNRIHDSKQRGILINNDSQGMLEDNDIFYNGSSGVEISDNSDPILRQNRIYNNKKTGIIIYDDGKGTLEHNEIFNNDLDGVEICTRANPVLRLNKIHDGLSNGVSIHSKGKGILEENEILANAFAGVEISESNPELRHNSIHDNKQNGISINNDSQGTIYENNIYNHGLAGIEVSNNSNPVVLRNSIHNNGKNGALIYNDCKGTFENNEIFNNVLTGIEISAGANPILRRNKIHDGLRGGVLIHNKSKGILEENEIFANAFAGVEISESSPELRRNIIHDSKQNGILISNNSQCMIEGNNVYSNAFNNIEIDKGSHPILKYNSIHEGKRNGLFIRGESHATIEDNDIFKNAQYGILVQSKSNPIIRDNKIHDDGASGIWIIDNGNGIIENNEIFGNVRSGVTIESGKPLLRSNRINKNSYHGISIYLYGAGTVENNDLRFNVKGAWDIKSNNKRNIIISGNLE